MPRYTTARELAIAHNALTGKSLPLPPPPKRRKNEESIMQQAVIRWWDEISMAHYRIPSHLLFSIPNGGRRDPKSMVFLKREGLRNGVCDLFLSVPCGRWHGLYVELKTDTGRVSDEQKAFIDDVCDRGYVAVICRSEEDAKKMILEYLALGAPKA